MQKITTGPCASPTIHETSLTSTTLEVETCPTCQPSLQSTPTFLPAPLFHLATPVEINKIPPSKGRDALLDCSNINTKETKKKQQQQQMMGSHLGVTLQAGVAARSHRKREVEYAQHSEWLDGHDHQSTRHETKHEKKDSFQSDNSGYSSGTTGMFQPTSPLPIYHHANFLSSSRVRPHRPR